MDEFLQSFFRVENDRLVPFNGQNVPAGIFLHKHKMKGFDKFRIFQLFSQIFTIVPESEEDSSNSEDES